MATAWSCKTKRRGRSRGIGQVAVDRRPMSPLPGAWHAAPRCKALWAASDQGYTPKVPVTSGGTARNRVIGPSVARLSEAWRTTARRARHVGRHSPVGYLFLQKFASCKGARSFLSVRSDVVCCTGRTCSSTGEETRLALLCEERGLVGRRHVLDANRGTLHGVLRILRHCSLPLGRRPGWPCRERCKIS
jgi:hypothetical protein